jgi:hypothetical protein
MNQATFETYKPKADEFKIAQPRVGAPPKLYVPTPHPFAQRLAEFRKLESLWTPGVIGVGK